jgi:hypothetical protein
MPAGCEFICKNDKCENYKSGFQITSQWPMGKIELIINSNRVKEKKEFRNYLIKQKDNGEKYAPIQLPNNDEIPIIAYKISLWSDEAKCIYSYPVIVPNLEKKEETIKEANLPEVCEKTGCRLRDFNSVINDGILCPSCKEKLQQNRWFVSEK